MRAVICKSFDGIAALEFGAFPDPILGPGQVLVEVYSAAVSFMDTLMVAGLYQVKPALPFVPGSDSAGVVLDVGIGVTRLQPGDRVACSHWHGGMAELMVAPENGVTKLPDSVGFDIASTVRYAYGTAHYALTRAQLKPGEYIFVSGAAGGVGLAAVDLASRMGATVFAGTSSTAKAEAARAQGADFTLNYVTEPVRARLQELTKGRGVDVYFDNVGGALFGIVSRSMAWGGRILPIGFTGGEIPSLAMNLPLIKNFSVVGCYWGAWTEREPLESRFADEQLFSAIDKGLLRPRISEILPLAEAAKGLMRVARREVTGRIVLRVRPGLLPLT